jgi:hypothetical protein
MEKGLYIGGFDALSKLNTKAWAEIWQGRVTFAGSGFTANDQVRKRPKFGLNLA